MPLLDYIKRLAKRIWRIYVMPIKNSFFGMYFTLRWEFLRQPPYSFSYFGYKLFYHRGDALVRRVSESGYYEPEVIAMAVKKLSSDPVVIDVGANIGMFTLALARLRPCAKIYCFEPSPHPYTVFLQSIIYNQLQDRIVLSDKALYVDEGTIQFYAHESDSSSGDGLRETGRAGKGYTIEVVTTTLDNYVKRTGLKNLELLKIDTEGAELYVLQGAICTIQRFRPKIIFEAWPLNLTAYNLRVIDLYGFLINIGYGVYDIFGNHLSEADFLQATTYMAEFVALPHQTTKS